MGLKKIIFVLTIILIFLSCFTVYATDNNQNYNNTDNITEILKETDPSFLTGCCSVMLQLEGNDSIMSFRRDADFPADIHIEEIDWHGMPAIKQYKTDGGYFCQVIITYNGWMIGYGGIDDGADNEKIENISATMITNDSSISMDKLKEIKEIKESYKMGHFLIKTPEGKYGLATATNYKTGNLTPNKYVSLPNKYSFSRSGYIPNNTDDKIKYATQLAISDSFGLTRRDVTTFHYHHVDNNTFKGNIVDMYLSNDDGSMFGMKTGDYSDNVYVNKTLYNASDIPIAPNYQSIGSYDFNPDSEITGITIIILVAVIIFIAVLSFVVYRLVKFYKN
ncbi:hypothetical protein [uncultured Methanobrevibacter sp.]|uniref:hypothetical protein n=1 Tax=uncultured Methanobrevibacter sp. TaxID=253161 RepID=UPI0025F24A2F|nr:hypothetical protein [uncultured Methanobrevibacter sp.]